ncbi:helix-turn-helix transcriptional regulator [Streptomyces sp. NPDC005892]|uniref:helix-turn-helix transcriptional regulator n=1 Tax=Streptomyces sp. NPDC005892 TaxID=3155593 RepID=UPI0033D5C63F
MTIAEVPELRTLLRTCRERRRYGRQEWSSRSQVSTPHLSRVETGAHPAPETIMHLSENLNVPLRGRSHLLPAAGYAPRYRDHAWDDVSIVGRPLEHRRRQRRC